MTIDVSRRAMMGAGAAGLAGFAAALRADAQTPPPPVPAEALPGAEALAGVSYTEAERSQMLAGLAERLDVIRALRAMEKPNSLAPALTFDPRLPGVAYDLAQGGDHPMPPETARFPDNPDDVAFASIPQLSRWLHRGEITSRALTEIYLERIARYGAGLQCFITVTPERARAEADGADRGFRQGRVRGWLHGVPYGLKDLFDAEGAPSTWGAEPYANRPPATQDSAVARKLREAGAVLLGKTALGALAYGDIWHDGVCKNPWNPMEGSSGSSAGSASATAAGLCAFAIGTETLGSIVSPSHRCGTTGLRPTFGRISRAGAMALCWSLDKVGPICRRVLDTAHVLAALNGADPADASSLDAGFEFHPMRTPAGMRVGYDPRWFEDAADHDRAFLEAARAVGATLIERAIPDIPVAQLAIGLFVEAAAAFEELTLNNWDDQLDWQDDSAWPNTFRQARFVTAIDYVQADRLRRRAMIQMHEAFDGLDAMIGPNFAGGMLTITNFTGHPQLAMRSGFIDSPARSLQNRPIEGTPVRRVPRASSLWAPLFEERTLIRLGHAIETRLGVAAERPAL
ncbi:MAG: amidase [Alphaproteobacteria bacterium]|nr:amidase [Alphaproteobacteria bacterium]